MTTIRRMVFGLILLSGSLPALALACLWDTDTLWQERYQFPETSELITGRFAWHTPRFYEWRIADRLERLKSDPHNLALQDDLAVAYDKTDQRDKAIEIGLRQLADHPRRYETLANLGTFYVHAGQYEEGLKHIDAAIAVNPDAHFGREKYQRLLVEYVQSRKQEGTLPLPLSPENRYGFSHNYKRYGFAAYILENPHKVGDDQAGARLVEARKGILGIMRFGKHDSPIVLEALGDVLLGTEIDAKQLAARAYLKASYETSDRDASQAYRKLAEGALGMQQVNREQVTLSAVETDFKVELQAAKNWRARVEAMETEAIAAGGDIENQIQAWHTRDQAASQTDTGVRLDVNGRPISAGALTSRGVAVLSAALGSMAVGGFVLVAVLIWVLLTQTARPKHGGAADSGTGPLSLSDRPPLSTRIFKMTIRVAIATIAACAVLFAGVGGGVGLLLGTNLPGYYRSVFSGGYEPGFDPVSVGVGQGLTQGLGGGIVVGLVLVALFVLREALNRRNSLTPSPAGS